VSRGYPIDVAKGGVLEKRDFVVITLPADFDRSTLTGSLRLYPSTLSTLEDGLESMLQEPCGCFEQASSSNYPNVLVLNYIGNEGNVASAATVKRAKDLLAHGYQRLHRLTSARSAASSGSAAIRVTRRCRPTG